MRNDTDGQSTPLVSWHAGNSESLVDESCKTGENADGQGLLVNEAPEVQRTENLTVTPVQETSTGGWGWNLLKINTSSLYSSMRRDLEELHHQATEFASGTVSSVARVLQTNVLVDDARKAAEFVRDGVDSVVRSIDETLQINHDQVFGSTNQNDEDDDAIAAGLTREELNAILNDSNTFTMEPRGSEADEFDKWATEQFNFDAAQTRIERLLFENDHVAKLYEDFVVSDKLLTHNEFWLRYFFRVRQACRERQRQLTVQTLTRRAGKNRIDETNADDAVIVMQPGSITDDSADRPLAASLQPHELTNRKLRATPPATTTTPPISGEATRFLQMVVDEECETTKKSLENDDVYSSASTESFSFVDQVVQHRENSAAKVMDVSSVTTTSGTEESPKRIKRNNRVAGDEDDGWEKDL